MAPEAAVKPLKRLETRFREDALLPGQILHGIRNAETVLTSDGVRARIQYITGYCNRNGWCEADLDDCSIRLYGMTFKRLKNLWESRIQTGEDWHRIKMTRIET